MSVATEARGPAAPAQPGRSREAAHAFLMVLWRDIFVTGRELPIFLAQVVLQPLFLLLIFGKILTELGNSGCSTT